MNASFFSGVEGVKSQNFGIDLTANNIANVNTPGFKYSNAEFKDVFYKSVSSQGLNPGQAGSGSAAAASKLVFEQGTPVASEGEFDVALVGKGFFGVLNPNGAFYTRNGSFVRDVNGDLVDGQGNYVLGSPNPSLAAITFNERVAGLWADRLSDGSETRTGFTIEPRDDIPLGDAAAQSKLSVPRKLYLPPEPTTKVSWSGNLNTATKSEAAQLSLDPAKFALAQNEDGKWLISGALAKAEIPSLAAGDKLLLTLADEKGAKRSYELELGDDFAFTSAPLGLDNFDPATLKIGAATLTTKQQIARNEQLSATLINKDGSKGTLKISLNRILPQAGEKIEYEAIATVLDDKNEPVGPGATGRLTLDKYGALISNTLTNVANPLGSAVEIDLGTPLDPAKLGSGYDGLSARPGREFEISAKANGVGEGLFDSYSISLTGNILAQFSNGRVSSVGKIALYNFINEEGLAAVGDDLFAATAKSGEASFITRGQGLVRTADFRGNFLEQSNVDLSAQLTQLIVLQKGFEASSKSITTSDQMIQRALELKK